STGFVEGYSKTLEQMTWKSRFSITRELVDDKRLYDMRKAAGKFMTSYNRTREEFARALYVGGLSGTTVKVKGKTFNCASADGVSLFNKSHPAKVKGALQTNLFADAFSASALGKMEVGMQNTCGDNGELLSVTPDTIWIPNDAAIRDSVFAAIGADKEPTTANNAFNYQYGRWNIIVDPYLNHLLAGGVKPWILLDSKFMTDQDGPVWLDRVKLEVRSGIDDNNDNNVWSGYARFMAGFVDWRFCAVGGMTGGSAL
ncbi:MAG: hypothetical protein RR426_09740, partial [Oscillospiraceae bacterium]